MGLNAVQAGFVNATLAPAGTSFEGAFAVGFMGGLVESALFYFAGVPCWGAAMVGGAITNAGNDYLQGGAGRAFSAEGLIGSIFSGMVDGLITYLTKGGCFVGGTLVLEGDGVTFTPIEQVRVGRRLATDGGVSDGGALAADPDATEVDPATWRLVTVEAGDWKVETLRPAAWLSENGVIAGTAVPLHAFVDLAEMGAPEGLWGRVSGVGPCPEPESGPGRVVLTTVTHVNRDVYTLTLRDASGDLETLGVTGSHRFYGEDAGWVETRHLSEGLTLRGRSGDLTVVGLVRDPVPRRVYNFTVEADHVYYVGDLTALTHNQCGDLRRNMEALGYRFLPGEQAAHLIPENMASRGAGIQASIDRARDLLALSGIPINSATNGFKATSGHLGTHTDRYLGILGNLLDDAYANGGSTGVRKALDDLGKRVLDGEFVR